MSIILNGLGGRMTVNSTDFEGVMAPEGLNLSDQEVADVLTYVLNNFGNEGGTITPAEVAAVRQGDKKQ